MVNLSKSNVDYNHFIENLSPESSYVLGLIWGDGYLNNKSQHYRISLEMVHEDLCQLNNIFNTTGRWSESRRSRINRKPQLTYMTSNKTLYFYLKDNNYEIKSGALPIILNNIPENLHNYWWRGYSDADGCFYINKKNHLKHFCLSSTYEQDWSLAEQLMKFLNIKYAISRRIQGKNKYSIIRISNRKDVIKYGDYIYSGESFGLDRKFQKFNLIKNW